MVRSFLLRSVVMGVAALPLSSTVLPGESRPNVVLILADDLGYADVGMHGCRDIPTPNIDRLAASGVRCMSGYSAHPFCSPMRASLMTGRYQHRFGYERNIAYDPHNRHMGLPESETTIATRLRQAGYATGMVGKWHLGAARPFHPRRRGFDFFYGFLGGGHNYFSVDLLRPVGEGYFQPLERNGKPEDLTAYLTTALSRSAVGFIESHREKPFFLYVAYNAPHTPMQAPQEYLDEAARGSPAAPESGRPSGATKTQPTKRQIYSAMVHAMDDGIGEILRCLERLKLRERTLVFFLSDNGGPERSNASRNDPLRGQ
ncbi:MAG: sulfatase-like hydrolase/transferase, partial [Planctomycetota bacterium]|nr:sulfatase-like hydrolase/transferase [Planctomycetota bacterium]